MREVPYVDAKRDVLTGTLISSLNLAGDGIRPPDSHQVWFDGEFPCNADGTRIAGIGDGGGSYNLGHGLTAKYHFSTKPGRDYLDYHEKMTTPAGIDSGMGLELVDGSLGGMLRVTASTPGMRGHVHGGRISFAGGGVNDIYSSNIQVADLNALNATLAVIKWKKLRGFYRDLEREHHCTYTTDGNQLENGDRA
ncbi:hypothetical protein PX52LOC_03794 [Limnoglobus roseus]|uniref:DUF6791 domain-containing protein n=1 Tax=Limnoglobus roseus TaxID=2598579 RepID=A0A5C1AC20_9BACT|nr:hypothetical protein PX52LOC_03794 [Limnoglobus roseus]